MGQTLRYAFASLALAYLVVMSPTNMELQTGMIPIVDTKPSVAGFNPCLISGWPMDDGSGTTIRDVSANANTAFLAGGSGIWQSNAGFPGTTLLSGSGTQITSTSTTLADFTGLTPFSVSAWIKIGAGQQVFLGTLQPSGYQGWELGTGTAGGGVTALDFIVSNAFPSNSIDAFGTTSIQDNVRHYVVATYDGSRNITGVKLYVDGSAQTVNTFANSLSATAATGRPVRLNYRVLDGEYVLGVEAFVEIYNCVLTPTQVATYNAAGPGIY